MYSFSALIDQYLAAVIGRQKCGVFVSLDFEGGLSKSSSDPLVELSGRWCNWNGEATR